MPDQETALGGVPRQPDRSVISRGGFGGATQPAEQVRHGWRGTGGAGPVPSHPAGPAPLRTLDLRQRHGPVERDDGARRQRPSAGRRAAGSGASPWPRPGASLCTALIAAWIWYGPGRLRRRHCRTSAWPSAMSGRSHSARSWSASSTRPPSGVRCGPAPGLDQQHQGQQPQDFRLVRHQLGQQPAQPDRLGAELIADQRRSPEVARVALVEDQVDDGQDGPSRSGRSAPWDPVRDPASRILALARTSRWAMVASGTRNACAISRRAEPAQQPQRQRDLGAGASAGWQQVKISRSRSSRTASLLVVARPCVPASSAAPGPAASAALPRGGACRWPGCGPW